MKILERDSKYFDMDESSLPDVDGVSTYLLKLLYARGARDAASVREFLNPSLDMLLDPRLFVDIDKAVARIEAAITSDEFICIFGDYDCDGICATAILARYLKGRGAKVAYHIPLRHEHGYGMNAEAVELLAANNVKLIITVDNGITAIDEVKLAKSLGIDVIITDHHRFQGELPDCVAVIAHTRPDSTYPASILCGAGVALKLVHALSDFETMCEYIPLAGLATIADIVPLIGENRVLAAYAIKAISSGNCYPGLTAILKESKPVNDTTTGCNERDLSFGVIPRINAAGRMEDARPGVSLFLTDDPDEAASIASSLTRLNTLRKEEEQRIYEAAASQIECMDITDDRIIMLYAKDWNPGVVGIAASRIADRYYRPTIIFSLQDDILTGSARSIEGVDIFNALHENRAFLIRYGGHARAAGATLKLSDFEAFKAAVNQYIKSTISDETFLPRQKYELDADLNDFSFKLVDELKMLAPFGESNPPPTFCVKNAGIRALRRIGADGYHLKFIAEQEHNEMETVFYGMGHEFDAINTIERCSIVCTPGINSWHGHETLQLRAKCISSNAIQYPTSYIDAHSIRFGDAFYQNMLYNGDTSHASFIVADSHQCLSSLLSHDITGSLVLCFTKNGAVRLLLDINQSGLWNRLDLRFNRQNRAPIAYNSVVLAPILSELNIASYRNVLIYDAAPSIGIVSAIKQLAPDAKLFVGIPHDSDSLPFICDRTYMKRFFSSLNAAMKRPRKHRIDVANNMALQLNCGAWECAMAIDIFLELGFLALRPGSELELIQRPIKRDLCESQLYCVAESMPRLSDEYKRLVDEILNKMHS